MSITAWDIKEAAFTSDLKDVEELIFTNKGAIDVGALSQAVNLRSLSLAFNSLASLSGLAALVRLQSLNVSHNQLASLKGLQALSCLVTLNASHNKIVSLGPLSGLSSLADLWLQNNCVAAPGELRVLAGLPGLQRLAIANNPLAKALPAEPVRLVALRLCPGLRVIDGRPVEQAEREASEALDLDSLLSSRPAAPASAPAGPPSLGPIRSLGSRPGSGGGDSSSRTPSYSGDGGRFSSGAGARPGPGRPKGRPSSGALGLPDSRLPAAALRRKARSNSFDSLGPGSTQQPDADNSNGDLGLGVADDADAALAAATAALEASASNSASFASSASFRSAGSSKLPRSGGGRRPPLPAAAAGSTRPAAQLQGTQFQAVLDALPCFDSSKLPTRYNGAIAKPRSASTAAVAKPPPDAHFIDYEAKYPAQRGGGKAIVIRRDGSAAVFWPGGDMAVTVDAEYGSAYATAPASSEGSSDDGGGEVADGGGRASVEPVSYKMMVMYRAGGVAVSWDAQGGFVQFPSGGLMLMYSRSTGSGTCYSPSGEITRRWRDLDAPAAPSPPSAVAISLPFPLASSSPRAPPPPPPPHVDMQLDPHLGIRFISATHSLELYLSCEMIRYRFRCGRNLPGDVWDPPPGRGDGTGSTATSRVQTPQYDSQTSTPPATSTRVAPVVGEACASGSVGDKEGGGVGGLPLPAFLRNLARQGGAGTHRPAGGAAAAVRQTSLLAAGGGGAGGDDVGPSAGEGLAGIASITAGLQALDEGLQALVVHSIIVSKVTERDPHPQHMHSIRDCDSDE
ncbi:hypothetical protein VOLCADRAFT_87559 [Volvox carteri f. nagariensis]|uniref:Uncharacterized protein n=1 Tax=Volvox carteri f. nagariensis TaxID=3068 RepID=D8TLM0_VOLCA|nr:uncharacterized protein VOLCADRAFT_87559 [Volvox carteri f. nagariensis]EFJ51758.1 hypothetical protein VOLCADRAFT_87559 [Volvox carteri f. nagariensis]|eukprot:XP_002947168.1 hypothetical protein VOLCADRAFT_87559 [Volvox carteri f. nagariensis]